MACKIEWAPIVFNLLATQNSFDDGLGCTRQCSLYSDGKAVHQFLLGWVEGWPAEHDCKCL